MKHTSRAGLLMVALAIPFSAVRRGPHSLGSQNRNRDRVTWQLLRCDELRLSQRPPPLVRPMDAYEEVAHTLRGICGASRALRSWDFPKAERFEPKEALDPSSTASQRMATLWARPASPS